MLISLLDLEKEAIQPLLTGTLWAIGRLAQVARKAMLPALPKIQVYAGEHKGQDTKEMTIWCMRQFVREL